MKTDANLSLKYYTNKTCGKWQISVRFYIIVIFGLKPVQQYSLLCLQKWKTGFHTSFTFM